MRGQAASLTVSAAAAMPLAVAVPDGAGSDLSVATGGSVTDEQNRGSMPSKRELKRQER